MIRAAFFLVLLILPSGLCANTARVSSGEHPGFTRLVVELSADTDWRLGRTATGYAFATTTDIQPTYDLGKVWDRIPRARLQALWADPETGVLAITMSCLCHAFPFEYRPGMIVIDLRDGPAPKGSVFESAVDNATMPAAAEARSLAAPDQGQAYDWLSQPGSRTTSAKPTPALDLPTGRVSLNPLRDELLEQISRGATEGVVDMRLSGKRPKPAASDNGELPWSRIRIGELPGLLAGTDRTTSSGLQPDGSACLTDAQLTIGDWGTREPGSMQLAAARSGLLGEFDVPDPAAVKRTMKAHLFLGFGAEAIQYASLLSPGLPDAETRLYIDLARIVDGLESPTSSLSPMLNCDGAAAMWAALLHSRLPTGSKVNGAAIVRSFNGLPAHLRQHLGPDLARKLQDRGDVVSSRMIRDAMARTPGMPSEDMTLILAKAALSHGDPDLASLQAETALAGGADGVDALLTMVEAGFQKGEPLRPDIADTVRAYLTDAQGTEREAALRRALVVALALSGQSHEATAEAMRAPDAIRDLWQVLGKRASDDDLLTLAIIPPGGSPPSTSPDVAMLVAERLVGLGFAEAALAWLGPVDPSAPAARRLVAAQAEQARGNAPRAIELLRGLDGPVVEVLRAGALVQLGEFDAAMNAMLAAGEDQSTVRFLLWQKDWNRLAIDGPKALQAAAGYAVADLPSETGALAQSAALLQDSETARLAVAGLLAAVPGPEAIP